MVIVFPADLRIVRTTRDGINEGSTKRRTSCQVLAYCESALVSGCQVKRGLRGGSVGETWLVKMPLTHIGRKKAKWMFERSYSLVLNSPDGPFTAVQEQVIFFNFLGTKLLNQNQVGLGTSGTYYNFDGFLETLLHE